MLLVLAGVNCSLIVVAPIQLLGFRSLTMGFGRLWLREWFIYCLITLRLQSLRNASFCFDCLVVAISLDFDLGTDWLVYVLAFSMYVVQCPIHV